MIFYFSYFCCRIILEVDTPSISNRVLMRVRISVCEECCVCSDRHSNLSLPFFLYSGYRQRSANGRAHHFTGGFVCSLLLRITPSLFAYFAFSFYLHRRLLRLASSSRAPSAARRHPACHIKCVFLCFLSCSPKHDSVVIFYIFLAFMYTCCLHPWPAMHFTASQLNWTA